MESTRIIETKGKTLVQAVREITKPTDGLVVLMSHKPQRSYARLGWLALTAVFGLGLFAHALLALADKFQFNWILAGGLLLGGLAVAGYAVYGSLYIRLPESDGLWICANDAWKPSFVGWWAPGTEIEALMLRRPFAVRSINHGTEGPHNKADGGYGAVPIAVQSELMLGVRDPAKLKGKGVDAVAQTVFAKTRALELRRVAQDSFSVFAESWLESGAFTLGVDWDEHANQELATETEDQPLAVQRYRLVSVSAPDERVAELDRVRSTREAIAAIIANATALSYKADQARIRESRLPAGHIQDCQERLKRSVSASVRASMENRVSTELSEEELQGLRAEVSAATVLEEDDAKEVRRAIEAADEARIQREEREAAEAMRNKRASLVASIESATPETSGGVRHSIKVSELPSKELDELNQKLDTHLADMVRDRFVARASAANLDTKEIASIRAEMDAEKLLRDDDEFAVEEILAEVETAVLAQEARQAKEALQAKRAEVESAIQRSAPGKSTLAEQKIHESGLPEAEIRAFSTKLKKHLAVQVKQSFLDRAADVASLDEIKVVREDLEKSSLSVEDRKSVLAILDEAERDMAEESDRRIQAAVAELRSKDPDRFDAAIARINLNGRTKAAVEKSAQK